MHSGTALSTFIIHNYDVGGKKLPGFLYAKSILSSIEEQYGEKFVGLGALLFFITKKMHEHPTSADKMRREFEAVLNYSAEELANQFQLLPEDLSELNEVFSGMMSMEMELLNKLLDHQYEYQEYKKGTIPNKKLTKQHTHHNLDKELKNFIAQLRIDDRNYMNLLRS